MWQPLCQRDCQNWFAKIRPCNSRCAIGCVKKKFVKRSLGKSRCAIEIRDAETSNKGYTTHAVPLGLSKEGYVTAALPLVFVANLFVKSSNISVCGMARLNLVTFRFSVGCRCAIGIVTQWCDFPPCDVTFLYLAVTLGDVTFRRVMWLKPGACSVTCLRATTQLVLKPY